MKKLLLVAAFAVASFANAQKGSILLAGNVGFASNNKGGTDPNATAALHDKYSTFDFSPKVGYQFSDNMTVGVELGLLGSKATDLYGTTSVDDKVNTTKLGAFLRYAMPIAGAFSFYTDLGLGMQNSKESLSTPGSVDKKYNGMYFGLTPAIGVNMNKGFCLNFSIGGLGYSSMKGDWTGAENQSTFGLTFGKQASVGISKNF